MTYPTDPMVSAVNRIADALFAQAKVAKKQVAISEQMLEMQAANLAVTRQLESAMTHKIETTRGLGEDGVG